MNEALSYLYYIFDKFVDFVFNGLSFTSTVSLEGVPVSLNVSVGWIAISCILFSLIIRSILNIPRGIRFRTLGLKQ